MHAFILLCLVAAAAAEHLGYNYEVSGRQNVAGGGGYNDAAGIGVGIGKGNGNGSGNVNGNGNGGAAHNTRNNGYNSNGIGSGSNSGFDGFTGSNDANNYATSNAITYSTPASLEYNKEFYTYNAPEEELQDNTESVRLINSLKKNLRVVFIKAPENKALTNAALQLAKQASEDHTAIYVLNKQADVSELAQKIQSIKSNSASKPEVHFVKYRTPEDAVHAQQAIQAQYDTFSGPSHRSNEAVAPVLNFVSSGSPFQTASSTNSGPKLKNTYLPTSLTKL